MDDKGFILTGRDLDPRRTELHMAASARTANAGDQPAGRICRGRRTRGKCEARGLRRGRRLDRHLSGTSRAGGVVKPNLRRKARGRRYNKRILSRRNRPRVVYQASMLVWGQPLSAVRGEQKELRATVRRFPMDFKLVSDYKPQGDQGRAIESLLRGVYDREQRRVCLASPARARPTPWPRSLRR